jgi:hypothetical protein
MVLPPPHVRADIDLLLEIVEPASKALLEKFDEFFPVAYVIDSSGQLQQLTGDAGEDAEFAEMLDVIYRRLDGGLATLRAVAILQDFLLHEPEQTDAIRIDLEHSDPSFHPYVAFLPYRRNKAIGTIEYGDLCFTMGTPRIWER